MFTFALVSAAVLLTLIAPAACLQIFLSRTWNPNDRKGREQHGSIASPAAAPLSQYG